MRTARPGPLMEAPPHADRRRCRHALDEKLSRVIDTATTRAGWHNLVVELHRVVAATGVAMSLALLGIPSSATAATVKRCEHADQVVDTLTAREHTLARKISHLDTAMATTPDPNVAARLRVRLNRLQARAAKVEAAVAMIESVCPGS